MVDAVNLAYLEAVSEAESKLQKQILAARKYHRGEQNVELSERMQQFLGESFGGFEFRLNVTKPVIRTMTERLSCIGFDSADPKVIKWAQDVWDSNKMSALQDDLFEAALRDGAHYMIVDWVTDSPFPRWLPQQQYTAVEVGGDGLGCFIRYPQNDPNLEPEVGVKYWTETINGQLTERRNLYYPNRVEKWARTGGGGDWKAYRDATDSAWPIPWVDKDGKPLGIAIIPFYNKGQALEAADAIPLQDAANKAVVDLLEAADQTAYRILVALGFIPTTDGLDLKSDASNALTIRPGIMIGTTKPRNEADVKAIEPAQMEPIMNLVQQIVTWIAIVTDTPVTRFITTKLIASDETLKQQEEPLTAKVENRQKLFGIGIMKCMEMSIKLAQLYAPIGEYVPPEDAKLTPIWASAKSLMERLEELKLKKDLGVPEQQLWTELGYAQDKVREWQATAAAQTAAAVAAVAAQGASTGTESVTDKSKQGEGAPNGNETGS